MTTGAAIGGLLVEAAARTVGSYFSDPTNIESALAGFPQGIGLALTPVLSGAAYSLLNWVKHRNRPSEQPPQQSLK